MATITLTIPDAVVTDVIAALCFAPAPLTNPNPTVAQAKQVIINYVKASYFSYKNQQAQQAITPTPDITIT